MLLSCDGSKSLGEKTISLELDPLSLEITMLFIFCSIIYVYLCCITLCNL